MPPSSFLNSHPRCNAWCVRMCSTILNFPFFRFHHHPTPSHTACSLHHICLVFFFYLFFSRSATWLFFYSLLFWFFCYRLCSCMFCGLCRVGGWVFCRDGFSCRVACLCCVLAVVYDGSICGFRLVVCILSESILDD